MLCKVSPDYWRLLNLFLSSFTRISSFWIVQEEVSFLPFFNIHYIPISLILFNFWYESCKFNERFICI